MIMMFTPHAVYHVAVWVWQIHEPFDHHQYWATELLPPAIRTPRHVQHHFCHCEQNGVLMMMRNLVPTAAHMQVQLQQWSDEDSMAAWLAGGAEVEEVQQQMEEQRSMLAEQQRQDQQQLDKMMQQVQQAQQQARSQA